MLERRLRLLTGLILAVYVIAHFLNHALGLWSVEAMEAYRRANALVWQSPIGTVALYGSFLVHACLALYALYRRTTLRMPWWEALQLILDRMETDPLAIGRRLAHERIGRTDVREIAEVGTRDVSSLLERGPGVDRAVRLHVDR